MNKSIAFLMGFIMIMLPLASAGIVYDEETRELSDIAGKWLKSWTAEPDDNWTADPVQLDGQSLYFGDTNVGENYAKQMTMSDDGAFGAINYAQTGPHAEINTYTLPGVNKLGQIWGGESLAISDDGNYMIVADEGRSDGMNPHIYFFGADEGPVWTYETDHSTSEVEDVDISNDGEYATACSSGSDGDNFLLFERENNTRIYNGSFSSGDGCKYTSISGDGTMVVWVQGSSPYEAIVYDIINQEVVWTHSLTLQPYDVDISGDGERIAFGTNSGVGDEVQVFDASDGTALWGVDTASRTTVVVWNHDHTRLALSDMAGYRWLYDGSGTQIWKTVAGEGVRGFAMNNDGTVIVSLNGWPDSLQVYNDISATPILHNELDTLAAGTGLEVDVSGDGKHIMAYDGEETIFLFTDGAGNGWTEEDSQPIWSKTAGYDIEVAISSGGTFAWSNEDSNPATLNYGKIPLYSNSYNHDTPIYDEMWAADDYTVDYTALGDLSGLWLMDEATGTVVADSSNNGNDGTLDGGDWITGHMGAGLAFDGGTVDEVEIPVDTYDALSTMSAFIWYNTDVENSYKAMMGNGGAGAGDWKGGWMLGQRNSATGRYYFDIYTDDGAGNEGRNIYEPTEMVLGGWHQVGFTFDNGEAIFYHDGVEMGTVNTVYDTLNDPSEIDDEIAGTGYNMVRIGDNGRNGLQWEGSLDEAVIYSDALSPTDVSNLYAISHDRFESGLMAHWRMEEGTGVTVADLSGNGNTATITGASWDTGYFGNGLDFDQSGDYLEVSNSPELNPAGGITVSHWVNHKGSGGSQTLTVKPNVFVTEIWADNDYGGYFYPGGVQKNIKTSGISFPENEWHLLTLTFDSPTCIAKIYLDSAFIKQEDWSGSVADCTTPADPSDMQIARWSGVTQLLNGKMDEIQVWSRALSATEITDLYNFQYHGNPSAFDSAQEGKYVVSRTSSGDGGGGIAFFDTHSGTLATPKWTTDVGPGDLVGISDNVAPIVITGSTNGEVELYNLSGTQLMSFTSDLEITGVAIMDDNSYAFASSADHYVYGWDLDPLSAIPAWSTFVDGAVIDMGFDDDTIAVVTSEYLVVLNTAGVEQWREKLQKDPTGVEFEAGRILIAYYTTDETDNQFRQIENDEDISMYYKPGVPVGLWTFDEGTGTTVEDRSGNGNTGTLNNGAHFTEGLIGGGVELDGVNDEVDFGRFTELDGAAKFTVSGWFKFDSSLTHDSRTLWKDDSFGFYMADPDHCRGYVYYDGGDANAQGDCGTDVIEYTTDNWIYFTYTYDGATIRLYRDGIEIQTQALADKLVRVKDSNLKIYGSFDQFEGSADEIAIYRTDLSALEIKQLYEDTKGRVYDVQDGLVGYWPLDDDADDYSSNGNDGVIIGAIPGEGHVGGAYEFDGVDDTITVSSDASLDVDDEMTVAFWLNADTLGSYNVFVGRNNGAWTEGWQVYWQSDHLYFWTDGWTVNRAYMPFVAATSVDEWHHIVATYDGATLQFYLDGVATGTTDTFAGPITDSGYGLEIGHSSGGTYVDGNIDEVAIWNRALNTDEIKTIFYKDQAQFQSGLLAYYPQSCDSCSWASDESSYYNYNNDVNKMAFSGGVSTVDGKINNGLGFDGVDDYGTIPGIPSLTTMSVSAWIYGEDLSSDKTIIGKGSAWSDYEYRLRFSGGSLYFAVYDNSAAAIVGRQYTGVITEDTWHHIVATWDGSTSASGVEIYLDGVPISDADYVSGVFVGVEDLGANTMIGTYNSGEYFEGTIDELGIWSRALSIEEIGELYNSRTHIDLRSATSGWTLHTSTGEKITDGYDEYHTGGTIAEDGTIATYYDDDLTDDAITEVYVYGSSSNSAVHFPKSGDMINLGDITTFDGATKLSIGTWVYRTGYNEHLTALVSKDGSFEAFISSGNWGSKQWLSMQICGEIVEFPTVSVPADTWTHVGFTWEGNGGAGSDTRKVYMDGVLADTQTTGTKATLCSTGDSASIGARSNGIYTLPGQMSDLRLYTEILNEDEMAKLASNNPFLTGNYDATLTPPKGWWKLTEDFTEGATAVDSSASGNDGTPIGAETYYNNMQARYGVFDGVDDYITLGQPLIDDAKEGLTFSIWFKEESFTAQTGVFSRRYAEDGLAIWNACDQWSFRLEIDLVLNPIYTTGNCDGEWHNFIGTWDGTTMRTYVDGNYQDETTPGCSPCAFTNTGYTFNIGRDLYSANYFDGFITDVRIYDTAISQADITAIAGTNPAITGTYAETFSTPIGWWKLNGNSDDGSSNENDGTENGGLIYQHEDLEEIGYTEGKGVDYTGVPEIRDVSFGNGGSTMVFGEGRYSYPGVGGRVGYYDSLGNGWQDTDFDCYDCESFHIQTSGITTTVMEDNRNLVWGTTYGNTEFKSPGLHPTTANVIAFWQLQAGDGRPVYTKVVPQLVHNGTFWAGAMAVSLDGDLWVESRYDGDDGQIYFVLYKYNVTGVLQATITQEDYPFMKKQIFNPDSRSSIDVATNGSVILSLDNNFAYVSSSGIPVLLSVEDNQLTGPGQVRFLGDTGLVALSGAQGSSNEYMVYNLHTGTSVWQFNADVTAFQIDSSDNGDYIIFTNGTQMLFKAPANNTLFTKAIPGVKGAAVANNGLVAVASSVNGWFVYDKAGNLLVSGGAGQRVYDIDLDHDGKWLAVSGYDSQKGTAWMEVWALEEDKPFYEQYKIAFRSEKSSDTGEMRSYRVMMGEGSVQVLWGWSGTGGAGAELYTFQFGITLIEIVVTHINFAFTTLIIIAIVIAMLGVLRKGLKGVVSHG